MKHPVPEQWQVGELVPKAVCAPPATEEPDELPAADADERIAAAL